MPNPLIAIVGRPNVGKSTLFNKIVGKKLSITENRPGVTRDRLYADAEWRGKKFTVVDTGGIELNSEDTMWREILRQADAAIDVADVILLMVDGKEELTSSDYDVAEKLRRSQKPVILVVNKVDNFSHDKLFEYYALGLGEPYAVSAEHSQGIGDVLDEAVAHFGEGEEEDFRSIVGDSSVMSASEVKSESDKDSFSSVSTEKKDTPHISSLSSQRIRKDSFFSVTSATHSILNRRIEPRPTDSFLSIGNAEGENLDDYQSIVQSSIVGGASSITQTATHRRGMNLNVGLESWNER